MLRPQAEMVAIPRQGQRLQAGPHKVNDCSFSYRNAEDITCQRCGMPWQRPSAIGARGEWLAVVVRRHRAYPGSLAP